MHASRITARDNIKFASVLKQAAHWGREQNRNRNSKLCRSMLKCMSCSPKAFQADLAAHPGIVPSQRFQNAKCKGLGSIQYCKKKVLRVDKKLAPTQQSCAQQTSCYIKRSVQKPTKFYCNTPKHRGHFMAERQQNLAFQALSSSMNQSTYGTVSRSTHLVAGPPSGTGPTIA
jgi:hypothetical protein